MTNALPTGMYLPGDSAVHGIDARAKIISFIFLVVMAVNTSSAVGYAALFAVVSVIVIVSGLPVKTALGPASRLLWFFIIIFLMNTCFFSDKHTWLEFWIFHPSPAGAEQGMNVVLRVFFVLVLGNILTSTTSPFELTKALEELLSPLRYLKVPTGQIAMIISVAVQFIPTLFGETDMIRKAQTARGARFDGRRLSEKAGAVFPIVIPIFLSAFRRADELSLAMEARGYRVGYAPLERKSALPPPI